MAKQNVDFLAFNRGRISLKALSRIDLERVRLFAEEQTNWMPRLLGSMSLRAGWEYRGSTRNNLKAKTFQFIYALSDQAKVEFTDGGMRVLLDDVAISRPVVTTSIANGSFATDLSGWVDADDAGAVSQWVSGGYLGLMGVGASVATRTQQVIVSGSNVGVEHGLRVGIERGVVTIKVGTSAGLDDIISATLKQGDYSFSFVPSGTFHITISSETQYQSLVSSVTIEAGGDMVIPSPYLEADLPYIRAAQSADVVFLACKGRPQYKLERRSTRSWGLARYLADDGAFQNPNLTRTTITPSALSGDITLTSSKPLFRQTHVGALFRLTATGQEVTQSFTSDNVFSDSIRITNVGTSRAFTISLSGSWAATVTLQRSVGDELSYIDVSPTYTANTVTSINDGLDNQIVYYRLAVKPGNYTSGTVVGKLSYPIGSSTGVVRVTGYTSSTSVSAIVLDTLGGVAATSDWSEGIWSDKNGYPSAVVIYEGRLSWSGQDKIINSITDAFESFDDTVEGDSGVIIRTLGSGTIANVNWALATLRLIIGTDTAEKVIRSNSLDDPLTPTAFSIKQPSTYGSTEVAALAVDTSAFFVNGNRLYEMEFTGGANDYIAKDTASFVPEIGGEKIVSIAVQRKPDTRIHCVKDDGTVAVYVFDANEDVRAWIDITTDGFIEDVVVSPAPAGQIEDTVHYIVRRTIGGNAVRYYEKHAFEEECVGGTLNKQADAFAVFTATEPTREITGLEHLEGKEVVVWADGMDLSPRNENGFQRLYLVKNGMVVVDNPIYNAIAGLPYVGRYKSVKLAYAARAGTPLNQIKQVHGIGVIMLNTHNRGLRYGSDFDSLDDMPLVDDSGAIVEPHKIWGVYDKESFSFDGYYNTDSRLCLEASAPRPCTLSALTISMSTNEKV